MLRLLPLGRSSIKPPRGRGVDWGNPLTRGVVLAAPLNEGSGSPYNLVNMRQAVSTGPSLLGWGATPAGAGRTNTTSDASGAYDTFATPAVSTSSFTIEALISASAYSTASGDAGPIAGFPQLTYLSLGGNSTPNVALAVLNNAVSLQSTRTIPLDVPVLLHLTYDGSTARLYIDGTLAASLATAQTAYTETIVRAFNSGNGQSGNMIGSLISLHVWDYPLSAAQISQRGQDPWGIYKPSPLSRYVSSAPTVTNIFFSDSGSFVESETLAASFALSDSGSFVDSAAYEGAIPLADAGSFVESLTSSASFSQTDSGSFVESLASSMAVSFSDAGTWQEIAPTYTANVSLVDQGVGVDTLGSVIDELAFSDTGTFQEYLFVGVTSEVYPDLESAIVGWFANNPIQDLSTLITGGIYAGSVPASVKAPFLILTIPDARMYLNTSAGYLENHQVHLTLQALPGQAASTMASAIRAVYNNPRLYIADGNFQAMLLTSQQGPIVQRTTPSKGFGAGAATNVTYLFTFRASVVRTRAQ